MARKLRVWRARKATTAGSSEWPSTPQFELRLLRLAVPAAFAVGLVVLRAVADEVAQREAVVAGDKVDARVWAPPALRVEVAAAGQAAGELRHLPAVAAPELAHRVAVAAVPLGPAGREVAHLVSALAEVPGFGNQLHLRQHGVLLDDVEERAQLVDLEELARQRAGEVEAEAVDVHVDDPVAQAVHDELEHARVPHVQRVAAPGEVLVAARVARREAVVGGVVDAAQRERGSEVVALGGVVVDHVENHLETGRVQRPHHHLELAHGGHAALRAREAGSLARSTRASCSPSSSSGLSLPGGGRWRGGGPGAVRRPSPRGRSGAGARRRTPGRDTCPGAAPVPAGGGR